MICRLQLKNAFPRKNLAPAPPKGLLRMKTKALLEEVTVNSILFPLLVQVLS